MGELTEGQLGPVTRIISGGQTGADRSALDWALHMGMPVGGWCPKGRLAEDGRVPDWYPLRETESTGYTERTILNVRDSHATVIFTLDDPLEGGVQVRAGGSALTARSAGRQGRPWVHLHGNAYDAGRQMAAWLHDLGAPHDLDTPRPGIVLNVAGSRQSRAPGIVGWVHLALWTASNALDQS